MKVIERDIYGKPLTASYEDYLIESLKDPREAKEYLNAALEDEDYRVFLLALRNVADAFGITKIATKAGLNRENIYRMLSRNGNPSISSLFPLLHAIGVRLNTELAKAEPKEVHYEIESEQTELKNGLPKYAHPEIQKVGNLPKSPPVYRPQTVNCYYQKAA